MPQLNFLDFAPQLFWLGLTFVVLYLLMSRVALPRVGNILDERQARIDADLAAARTLREETDKAITDYEKALADAKARAQQIVREAREEMGAEIDRQRAEVDSRINAKMVDAEKSITALKASALSHTDEIATELAEELVAHLLGKQVDRSSVAGAVQEALGN
ncbi:MAG: F0F1 ATP synthase subunit B' [Hyphomicrobiales bacterium]|nr:F0F1 ATP synthase subunit B' [Hyphomicrobiales bacterium]